MASRRAGTYWLRLLVAAALILISTWVFVVSGKLQPQMVGRTLFYTLTGGVMLYVMLAGLRSTSDCLSEEKRDGTLGLLFLTDLRGYDVVLGKLLANSLAVFYCVLAVLPVLAVPLLMGGVEVTEFARLVAVIVNSLFFSLSAGMLASAICTTARASISWTLLLILLVTAGGPGLGLVEWWLRHWQGSYHFVFLFSSPVFNFFSGVDEFYKRGFGTGYVVSLIFVHVMSWVYLLAAGWLVRRTWQDKPATVDELKMRGRVQSVLEGNLVVRNKFRTRCLDRNAFYWLATKPRQKALWSWMPLVIAAGVWIWGLSKFGRDCLNPGMYVTTAIALGFTYKAMIGGESGRRLIEDRKSGALELLLSTPLSVKDIARGQRLALQRQFTFPMIAMTIVAFCMWLACLAHVDLGAKEREYALVIGLLAVVIYVADVVALYWMGMWHGLSMKNPKHAFGSMIVPILILPWIAMGLTATVITLLPRQLQMLFEDTGMMWPLIFWVGFSLLADVGFGLWARNRFLTKFREVATQRFQPPRSWWQKLFGTTSHASRLDN